MCRDDPAQWQPTRRRRRPDDERGFDSVPTYQYVCTDCGEALEVQQSFNDDSLTTCPTCGGKLRKVFNAVGVVFKGSGFYRNDSRTAAGSGSDSGEGSGSGEDKSGSKPDKVTAGADKGGSEKSTEAKGGAEKAGKSESRSSSAPAKTAGSAA
jgi:putative FmdB family regulatory protein